jgi:hypothetical protein
MFVHRRLEVRGRYYTMISVDGALSWNGTFAVAGSHVMVYTGGGVQIVMLRFEQMLYLNYGPFPKRKRLLRKKRLRNRIT